MRTVVPAEGAILDRVRASLPLDPHHGLSREAFGRFDAAQAKTTWGRRHRRRFALVDGHHLLASADRYQLTGVLDQQAVSICAIGSVVGHDGSHGVDDTDAFVDGLLEDATREGADMALLFGTEQTVARVPDGFAVLPTIEVEVTVDESHRHGAPMALVRGGEDRDLDAIVAMGRARARHFRWHLVRDVDFVKHAITRKRLLAGLGGAGIRQLQFLIAEEGITAAAYIVISVVGRTWAIEECGDRDPSGARVGALLQALIAREPAESRPIIRGWLPAGFVPPQVTIASALTPTHVVAAKALSRRVDRLQFGNAGLLYWRNDVF